MEVEVIQDEVLDKKQRLLAENIYNDHGNINYIANWFQMTKKIRENLMKYLFANTLSSNQVVHCYAVKMELK